MTRVIELTPLPKRLQLGPMAVTLPERIALTRREQLDYSAFLEIILSDEVNRRAHRSIETRLAPGQFPGDLPLGGLRLVGVNHPGPPDTRRRLLLGVPRQAQARPAGGWGRPEWARASWPRPWATPPSERGSPSASSHADGFFRSMSQARMDNSVERTFRSFLSPDLPILDDLGLHRLTGQQSAHL